MTKSIDPHRIALIGFGEVGLIFGKALVASGRHDVAAYDILVDDRAAAGALRRKAEDAGVALKASAADAARGARIVVSAVTAASARDVAQAAAGYLGAGQLFLDINSVSPETKRANAADVERSGARYVEAAVMAPVPPHGLKVPILLGGSAAPEIVAILGPLGMKLDIASTVIGQASAIKMCRSLMIKGIEALTIECLMTARRYGVEDRITASLGQSFPNMDWEKLAGYMIGRAVQHGRRRAAEMRESASMIAGIGLDPLMASATAAREDFAADCAVACPGLKELSDAQWREALDLMLTQLQKDEAA
ncbi:MAG: DUF1932 domain-containing protein [Hyphomicrobiales bacterium]